MDLSERIRSIPHSFRVVPFGRVEVARGLTVIARGPDAPIGQLCWIDVEPRPIPAEVVGFLPDNRTVLTPYQEIGGLRPGTLVRSSRHELAVPVGSSLRGRVLDGMGEPLDGFSKPSGCRVPIRTEPINPLSRRPVSVPLWTGIRVIDGLMTLGRGQRVGVFSGAGLGKTTLIRNLLAHVAADVSVVALVGERGREIADFYQNLNDQARAKTVLVVATSDSPAIMRCRAMDTALRIAEQFREDGLDVLLVVDSLTRVAMAQSEIGMQGGEVAAVRGYTPSVFHLLPRILERAGHVGQGSITGLYTVLLDADDPADPIGDAVRGLLDGHVYLSRRLAETNFFPAIDVVKSLSRLMPDLVTEDHWALQGEVRAVLSLLERSRDMVELGAYQPGTNPLLDRALALEPDLNRWLSQNGEPSRVDDALEDLRVLIQRSW